LIWVFFCYLLVHFCSYVLLFRHLGAFKAERPIFLYHAVPALAVTVVALGTIIVRPTADMVAAGALVVSVHGIYSLSFLELWSLAQGSYSVNILARLERARRDGAQPDLADLENIGTGKKVDRLAGLQRLALIRPTGQGFGLSRRGRIAAAVLYAIVCLANVKEAG
jgi:hypothetical protein